MQHDVFFALEEWCTLLAQLTFWPKFVSFAVIRVVFIPVRILESLVALLASELCAVEYCEHNSIHFLEALPLIAVRALVLAQNHTVCLVPLFEALLTVQ